MKIADVTSKVINEAKISTQKVKEKFKENVAPKIKEVVNDVFESADANYPKTMGKVKNAYTKIKNQAREIAYEWGEVYKDLILPKPKIIKLKENVWILERKLAKQDSKLSVLKATKPNDYEEINKTNIIIEKLKQELQKARKAYFEFEELQNAAQTKFDNLNNICK